MNELKVTSLEELKKIKLTEVIEVGRFFRWNYVSCRSKTT